jgi:type I site-specific restriction endonuclease
MLTVDPLSVIGVIVNRSKALPGFTNSILAVIDEVKNLHPSIQGIDEEVQSLQSTLDAINGSLASLSPADTTAKNEDVGSESLWAAAYKGIHDCELAIHQLYDCLKGFKMENSDVEHQKLMTLKFNQRERQLQALRRRVKTHNTSLQLVLQMISA